jgi:hypothetical protein
VNEAYACHVNWVGKELAYNLHVSTSLGKTAMASKFVLGCNIQVGRETLQEGLIVMTIGDYDLILGMDWLSKHGAQVDYKNKSV